MLTSLNQILAIFDEVLRNFLVAEEVVNAEKVKDAAVDVEERGHAQHEYENGKVDVEAVADHRDHVHVPH